MSTITDTDNRQEVEYRSREVLGEDLCAYIDECVKQPHPAGQLISVLHKVQDKFGYLAPEAMDAVAQLMQVPSAKVTGVASFYHFFRLQPRGKYMIRVCLGTACYVKGAQALAERFTSELGVKFGETTGDNLFSLEGSRCLGTCGLAPVIMIEDNVHAQVSPDQVPAILEQYRRMAREEA